MSTETIFMSLITLAVGAFFCFAGYRLFRVLITIWGFFIGLFIGGQIASLLFGGSFLATPFAWVVGIILGLILGGFAYALYSAAITILGASVGYLVGIGLMSALGFDGSALLTLLAGVCVALL